MQLTQLVANDTLLTYALSTAPSPLQVSPQSGPPSVAALTFVISCPVSVGSVTVTQIAFNLPVGDPTAPESTDLTEVGTGITPSVSSADWQIGPGTATGSFVLTPASGNSGVISSQGLTVTLVGIQVGPIVGTALINIVEDATDGNGPAEPLLTSIAVAKFPYGVVVGDFAASAPLIQNGATVTLSWIGSVGPAYTLLWAQQSQNVTSVNQWTSPDLTDTTTFILSVVAQEDGQTVTIQFSVTVIVADPDITATTLDVLQASTLAGDVTVGSTAANANLTVNGTLVANTTLGTLAQIQSATSGNSDDRQLNLVNNTGGSNSRAGLAFIDNLGNWKINADNGQNALSIYASTPNPNMNVVAVINSNGLNVNGAASVSGRLSVSGGLTANGSGVALFGTPTLLASGTNLPNTGVQALTDGFAVVQVLPPGSGTASSYNYGQIYTAGQWFQVQGGNVGQFGSGWDYQMGNNHTAMTLPIASGSYWQYASAVLGNLNQENGTVQIWWFPLGSVSGGQETHRLVAERERSLVPVPPHALRPATKAVDLAAQTKNIADLSELLGRLFNHRFTAKEKQDFIAAVAKLM